MKGRISLIILLVISCAFFVSCNSDGDPYYVETDFGTIISGSGTEAAFLIKFDSYGVAFSENGLPTPSGGSWKVNDRVYASFYVKEVAENKPYGFTMETLSVWKLDIEKPFIITSPEADTLGNAPFYEEAQFVNAIWMADHFLSATPYFYYSNLANHKVYLAVTKPMELSQAADTVNLQLRHKIIGNDVGLTLSPSLIKCYDMTDVLNMIKGKDSVVFAVEMPVIKYQEQAVNVKKYATYKWKNTGPSPSPSGSVAKAKGNFVLNNN